MLEPWHLAVLALVVLLGLASAAIWLVLLAVRAARRPGRVREDRGASMVEYGLLCAGAAVVLLVPAQGIHHIVRDRFDAVISQSVTP